MISMTRMWTDELIRHHTDRPSKCGPEGELEEEECVCVLSFTSLWAAPHPAPGQPSQKHIKTTVWAPPLLNWIQRAMQHDRYAAAKALRHCSLRLNYTTYKCQTRPQKQRDNIRDIFIAADRHIKLLYNLCCPPPLFPPPSLSSLN